VNLVVVHAEDQNTGVGIRGFQARDHLETAYAGQIQIQDDQSGSLLSEYGQRLLAARRFPDFGFCLRSQQSPQSDPDNRMIVDNKDFHSSAACAEVETASRPGEQEKTVFTAKPSPAVFERVK
jgi:hypothetical protein